MNDQTFPTTTLTGQTIASPAEYWPALERAYPDPQKREEAVAAEQDHFGTFAHFGRAFRCFKCGHLCE